MVDGRRVPVDVGYAVSGDGPVPSVGFAVGAYDSSLRLTIDPTLAYSTFLGGTNSDIGYGIAVDAARNAYITGETYSTDFRGASGTNAGNADAFLAKLNAAGSALVYATYIGGSALDNGWAVAIDGAGNAYVTGRTESTNCPTLNPALARGAGGLTTERFVAKLNTTGGLVYSTYMYGWSNVSTGRLIAVDGSGSAYVIGNHAGDVLASKLNPSGGLAYSLSGASGKWVVPF